MERMLRPGEMLQGTAVTLAVLALLAVSIATGRFLDWLLLLFIPTRVAALILQICFSWLPHHPFDRTERYLNTRISLWPGGSVLMLQQNLHLMHHLWPSVPFYNYGRLYRRLRPTLIAKGSPIQGLMVGRYAQGSFGPAASSARHANRCSGMIEKTILGSPGDIDERADDRCSGVWRGRRRLRVRPSPDSVRRSSRSASGLMSCRPPPPARWS